MNQLTKAQFECGWPPWKDLTAVNLYTNGSSMNVEDSGSSGVNTHKYTIRMATATMVQLSHPNISSHY